ncbi:MAG TPA: hypothetical protein VFX59_08515 [Polyangiales bacterium]|nr:hypothetical protein [Polyangiales bacterium]
MGAEMADTEQPELSIERFQALVEAYGGDVERFPLRERAGARELLRRDAAAQRLVQAARAFDSVLEEARLDVSPAVIDKLSAIPHQYKQNAPVLRLLPFRSARQTWLAAAAAVLLGLVREYASDEPAVDSADISALTFADDLFDDLTQEGDVP